ncbi:CLUMA_CG017214, isoform A [Clunio marinus]|uniref:CLUMA_CG017214, isoform A n=1 Tax=Clunio marinus TaxID=568069 RepID=A0A1J1IV62_9DIPT|nr:CLUMA_CG017214, isoform A [Clunio marinus]
MNEVSVCSHEVRSLYFSILITSSSSSFSLTIIHLKPFSPAIEQLKVRPSKSSWNLKNFIVLLLKEKFPVIQTEQR